MGLTLFDPPIPVYEARPPSSSLSGAAPGPIRTRAILSPPGLGADGQGPALSDPPFSSSCSKPRPDHRCPVLFGDKQGSHPERSLQRSTDGPTHYDPSAPVFKARPHPTSLLGASPDPNLNPVPSLGAYGLALSQVTCPPKSHVPSADPSCWPARSAAHLPP